MPKSVRGEKTKQALDAKIKRIRTRLLKAKASLRKQKKEELLRADAMLGAIVREQHPELAKLFLAAGPKDGSLGS